MAKVKWAKGKPDLTAPPDLEIEVDYVEGLWDEITGRSWMMSKGNIACLNYAMRSAVAELPVDDNVYYVKINNLGYLVHESELVDFDGVMES